MASPEQIGLLTNNSSFQMHHQTAQTRTEAGFIASAEKTNPLRRSLAKAPIYRPKISCSKGASRSFMHLSWLKARAVLQDVELPLQPPGRVHLTCPINSPALGSDCPICSRRDELDRRDK